MHDLTIHTGYAFTDASLLDQAMSHRSWCAENDNAASNERLEFLGDAVVGWAVAELVYRRYPDLPEGQLTNLRKAVVNAIALAEAARSIDLGLHLKLGRGEQSTAGQDKPSILSDAFEALVGAVFLDGGAGAAAGLVARLLGPRLDVAHEQLAVLDEKSRLQELVAARGEGAPLYTVRSHGPDHAQRFFATAVVEGVVLGTGEGSSKKAAERAAAAEACERIAVLESPVSG